MARVLVVDDVYTIRLKTELILRQSGYIVQSCSSGTEAIEAARANRPDAVILDIVMADMDGFATLRTLRACGITCPVIAYTSRRERRDGEFKTRGFDAYIPKSDSLSGLLALLRILIGRFSKATTNDDPLMVSEPSSDNPSSPHIPMLLNRHIELTNAN